MVNEPLSPFVNLHLKAYKNTGFNVREYDLIAEWYASERVDQTGVPEATTLAFIHPTRIVCSRCWLW